MARKKITSHMSKPKQLKDAIEIKLEYREEDRNGYSENNLTLQFYPSGAFSASRDDDEGFIYFYPQQAEDLRSLLVMQEEGEKTARKFKKGSK